MMLVQLERTQKSKIKDLLKLAVIYFLLLTYIFRILYLEYTKTPTTPRIPAE